MPLRFFKRRTPTGANIVGLVLGTVVFGMFFLLSLYQQQVLSYSAVETGVGYLAVALTAIVASGVAQALVTKIGVKPCSRSGWRASLGGLLWFTQISTDGTYFADLFGGFMLVGIGLGFSFVPVSIAALAGIPPREAGLASGLINTSQQIGGALGRRHPHDGGDHPHRDPARRTATPSSRRSPAASPARSGWRPRSRSSPSC